MQGELKIEEKQLKRIKSAEKDLRKIEKRIGPYIKKRDVYFGRSTAGKWCDSSEICLK